ncbi:MAG: hypothetical protein KGY78_10465, partial [Anaerolineae bacterium]|nr:hypothetical protein [Anaerolineae bacterium]
MLSRKSLNTALTICTLVLALGALGTLHRIGLAKAPAGVTQVWTLQGRVYEGGFGDQSTPLQGVNVALYGANASYP